MNRQSLTLIGGAFFFGFSLLYVGKSCIFVNEKPRRSVARLKKLVMNKTAITMQIYKKILISQAPFGNLSIGAFFIWNNLKIK